MRLYSTYDVRETPFKVGPTIIATSSAHARLAIAHQGLPGTLNVGHSKSLVQISPRGVEWDDLLAPSKLQLN